MTSALLLLLLLLLTPRSLPTLSDEDLDDDSGGVGAGGGDNKRNPAVHVTKYVNTDGIFRGQFRGLRRRVMAVAAAVSARQGWGSTGPSTSTSTSSSGGGGGKVSGSTPRSSKGGARRVRAVPPPWGTCWRRGCGWKPRVCEYHVYGRGGRLTEEGHTDVGSLVTVVGLYKLNPFYP